MAGTRPSNPLALAVLALLTERPMHPYQMSSTLKERRKEESIKINYGSLYAVVESLHKRGLIEVRETVREGNRPQRTIYAITEAGEIMLVDWLSDLLSTPTSEFPQFEAALSLMPALSADIVVGLLDKRLATQQAALDAGTAAISKARAAGMPRIFSIEHEYELALLGAEVEFVRELLKDLRTGDFSGLAGWRRMDELRAAGTPTDQIEAQLKAEFPEDYRWLDRLDELT
jgi:DNA-binding PadR family transcriptional regulator